MAPGKWDEEDSDSSSGSSPAVVARRGKFDDEEEEDVLDSWDAAEDSEVEREKEKKAAEAKAKAEAEAKANHKSKAQRREELIALRKKMAEEGDDEEELTEAERRAIAKQQEIESDIGNFADLLGDIGVSKDRSAVKPIVVSQKADDPTSTVDLTSLPLFNPKTKEQFTKLKDTLAPLISNNTSKAQYSLFLQEFVKALAKELPSEQIKKVASGLTTLSNEKMREEKAAEKGGKKTKAAKTKASLVATRDVSHRADTAAYDDDFGDDDFM